MKLCVIMKDFNMFVEFVIFIVNVNEQCHHSKHVFGGKFAGLF